MKREISSSAPGAEALQTGKKAVRAAMRAERRALSPEQREGLSLAAQKNILASPQWEQAQSVALYMAMPEETDTALLLRAAWDAGKQVQLPYCHPHEAGYMEFFACAGLHELKPGPFGILEPDLPKITARQGQSKSVESAPVSLPSGNGEGEASAAPASPPDLIIVPGVAFDLRGHRLGMGGGYYDRLFARPEYTRPTRIGLAFAFQLVEFLPGEDWDLPVHALSTERGLQWIQTP